jgi:hypothetical protein
MIGLLKKILIPPQLVTKLYSHYRIGEQKKREDVEKSIPKVLLSEKHMKNCELLLNRSVLLSKLKRNGHVAEIGVDRGDFSDLIIELTDPVQFHLIDMWNSERYHEGLFETVKNRFEKLILSGRVQIHRKFSISAAEDFPDNYFDWIYIDTGHDYPLTRDELRKYAPKVKSDGIIAGHDYSMGNWVSAYRYGVIEAVHEFCIEFGWELIYLTLEPAEMQSFAVRKIQE